MGISLDGGDLAADGRERHREVARPRVEFQQPAGRRRPERVDHGAHEELIRFPSRLSEGPGALPQRVGRAWKRALRHVVGDGHVPPLADQPIEGAERGDALEAVGLDGGDRDLFELRARRARRAPAHAERRHAGPVIAPHGQLDLGDAAGRPDGGQRAA